MVEVKRSVKLITEQKVIDKDSGIEGFPMRQWSIRIYIVDPRGNEYPADIFSKVEYRLHPTFPKPIHVLTSPPFKIQEEGWGEFDMTIALTAIDKGGEHTLSHDLNFQKEKYEALHTLTFKNPKPGLLERLRESGTVPGDENGVKGGAGSGSARKGDGASGKRVKRSTNVDMDRLADGLQKLAEDDLLQVVQMVHDNKAPDTYIKNDLENGEFHVDLYTLPDSLVKMLWEYVSERGYGDR